MPARPYLNAREAAQALGVSLPTLYAYVSRGLVRSEPGAKEQRSRRYSAEDIAKLRERKQMRLDPLKAAQTTLHWGLPALDSALTLVDEDGLYYRGRAVIDLALEHTFEEVASLLWTGGFKLAGSLFAAAAPPLHVFSTPEVHQTLEKLSFVEAFFVALAVESAADPAASDLRPERVARSGARILRLLTAVATQRDLPAESRIAQCLGQAWAPEIEAAASLINSALILCADHELNVSAFTARCAASAGSAPYAVVSAGLAALQGTRHGGHTRRVEAMLGEVERSRNVQQTLGERLSRGEPLHGFGHRLYPSGDPRARFLLEQLGARLPSARALELANEVTRAAHALTSEHPSLDFALVILARALDLPADSPLALFALGRSAGWIAHAIEQYQTGQMIRPRARYTGPNPR